MSRLVVTFLVIAVPLRAQLSLAVGVGTVRVPDTTAASFSTATASAALLLASSRATANFTASLATLPGALYAQSRADLWGATPPLGDPHFRLGAEAIWSGARRSDSGWSAALHGIVEALWSTPAWGLGVGGGPSSGWIENEASVTALHLRARAWWQLGATAVAASIEPTRFLGAWFTDATASAYFQPTPQVNVTLWAGGRFYGAGYAAKGDGGAQVQAFVASAVALEASAGAYLPEPYQGFPRTGYFTAGVRWFPSWHGGGASPPTANAPGPLVPDRVGDSAIVRFSMPGAVAVAIAGDWNDWTPMALHAAGGDVWEGALALARGTYRFNLLVDGTWVVPGGVATVSDGMGGRVALLVVP